MLVLSRKKNESVVINDYITVVVVDIRGDKVRLGIEAPKEVSVFRKEIHDSIQKELANSNLALPNAKNKNNGQISHEIQTTKGGLFVSDTIEQPVWDSGVDSEKQKDEESVVSNIIEIVPITSSQKQTQTKKKSSGVSSKVVVPEKKSRGAKVKKMKLMGENLFPSKEITLPVLVQETSSTELSRKNDSSIPLE